MPDQPGKGPLSSPPLSVEDADRLADNFTAFWEDASDPAMVAPPPAAPPSPAAVAPKTTPAVTVKKPLAKQTLLGIAPLKIGAPPTNASGPAPAPSPSVVATQPLPAVAAIPVAR